MDTAALARAIAGYGPLGQAARERAALGLLDWTGLALAGSREPTAAPLLDLARDGGGPSTVVGANLRADPRTAALINGTAAHALDFDDTHAPSLVHVSAPILAAVLAVAEPRADPGEAVVTAYGAGVETAIWLGHDIGPALAMRGFHSTGLCGAFGAAAGVARLLELSADEVETALGIVAAQTAGLTASFGTMTKPLQAGKAAMNGLLSAQLAARGFTGATDVLDRADGWLVAYVGEVAPRDREFGADGLLHVSVKPYPSCLGTHAAIDAALVLRDQLDPEQITDIECTVGDVAAKVAAIPSPTTGLAGKFSLAYCIGRALRDGSVGSAHFADQRMAELDPQLLAKVRIVASDEHGISSANLRITLQDGKIVEQAVAVAKGDPQCPLTAQEAREKFSSLAEPVLGAQLSDELHERILRVHDVADIGEVMQLAAGGP